MRTIKLSGFIAASVVMLFFIACGGDGGKNPDTGKKSAFTNPPTTVSSVNADTPSGTVSFATTEDWKADVDVLSTTSSSSVSCDADAVCDGWISVSPKEGKSGTVTLAYTLDKNFSGANRQAEITITSGGETKSVTITQKNTDSSGEILKASIAFGEDVSEFMEVEIGKNVELAVAANTAFEVSFSPIEGSPEDGITCNEPGETDTVVTCKPIKRGDYTVTIVSIADSTETATVTLTAGIPGMVYVKAGTFTMGCSETLASICGVDSRKPHEVTLTEDYYIGKMEVTQAEWESLMGTDNNPSEIKDQNLPVTNISWYAAHEFIDKLNERDAETGRIWRLPTEAEWEYAARGGSELKNCEGGCRYSGSNSMAEVAWYVSNSEDTVHPVGLLAPNELGLYDMSGNVNEWVEDFWASYSSDAQIDPTGPESNSRDRRVLRGGGYIHVQGSVVLTARGYQVATSAAPYYGFRLALTIPDPATPTAKPTFFESASETVSGVWDSAVSGVKSLWNSITK
jgi:formylglycine-generating enzyme required for sulfatase activity